MSTTILIDSEVLQANTFVTRVRWWVEVMYELNRIVPN